MTSPTTRRVPAPDATALEFLIDDFIDVDVDEPEPTPEARHALLSHAARLLLPSPKRGSSRQQTALMALDGKELFTLRREVRNWLERLVCETPVAGDVPLRGPRIIVTPVIAGPRSDRRLLVEGSATSVFWYYLVALLGRVGLEAIGVCLAPQARLRVPCLRLFVRRGRAKEYCSEQCRARMTTRRARGFAYPNL